MGKSSSIRTDQRVGQITTDEQYFYLRPASGASYREVVNSLRGSHYDRSNRLWCVPLEHFYHCMSLPMFSSERLELLPSREQVLESVEHFLTRYRAAWTRIKANPFVVTSKDIALARPHVVLKLRKELIIQAITQDSHVLLLMREFPFEFSSDERILVHAQQVPQLLKLLRTKKISFAVEQTCAEALTRDRNVRENLLQVASAPGNQLRSSLVSPFLDLGSDARLRLIGATPRETSRLLSWISDGRDRQRVAKELSLQLACLTLWSSFCHRLKLWISNEALNRLQQYQPDDHPCEESLALHPQSTCWCLTPTGEPVLLVREAEKHNFNVLPGILGVSTFFAALHPQERFCLLFFQESTLDESYICSQTCINPPVTTNRFLKLRQQLQRRKKLLEEREKFQKLSDTQVGLKNSTLERALFPHQRVAVKWILHRECSLVGDDMGLGKTLSVLASVDELLTRNTITKALIICPNSLMLNWQSESRQWTPDRSTEVLPKGRSRNKTLQRFIGGGLEILVVNYEAARIAAVQDDLLKALSSHETFLCLDESQRVKNSHSQTFLAISAIAQATKRRVLLSGTPTPKNITDIWSQMFILDGGERLGGNYFEWLESVAELGTQYSQVGVKRFLPHRVEETRTRVREILLRRRKEHVLDLPPKTFMTRNVPLSGSQLDRYEEIREELRVKLTSSTGKTYRKEIHNILEQYLRAVQVASNPRLIDANWRGTPAKFKELDNLLEQLIEGQQQKVVVWTNYLENIEELLNRYRKYHPAALSGRISQTRRHEIVDQFQTRADDIHVLVAIPAAAGVGLTLTAAQTAIYLDKTWNAEHWLQSIDRIHRIGQTGTVTIVSLNASKIDLLIGKNLQRKCSEQAKLMDQNGNDFLPTRDELLEAVSS